MESALLSQTISDFLRDAQYKVGLLSTEIDAVEDKGSYQYQLKVKQRLELTTFMDVVYEGKWYIISGYNHIQYTLAMGDAAMWSEKEVIQEIEHLRYYTNMNEVPFITFTAHYPQIVNSIGSGGSGSGAGFPAGLPGQTIFFDASKIPYADDIDPYGGMNDSETITSYFSGRP